MPLFAEFAFHALCRLLSGLQKVGYNEDEVNAVFEELDWNHSQSITRDEWISFRVNKNLALAQGSGRGISAVGTRAKKHLANILAKNEASKTHPAPPSASAISCETNCAAVAADDVWNEAFILLLTRSYSACFKLIRMCQDELIPKLNATDTDRNTLLHACALSLNHRHRLSVSLNQDLADTEEDVGVAKTMPVALPKIIKYLLDMGIEIQKNSQGQTPADVFKANGITPREIDEVFRHGVQLDGNDGEDKDILCPLSSESGVRVPAMKTFLRKGQARRVSLGSVLESQPTRHMPPVSVSWEFDSERGEKRQSGIMT